MPRDLAVNLARDVATVAVPMLQSSTVLEDSDLIEIIHTQDPAKQMAIAGRDSVSHVVADALVETNESVVATLIGNNGADISETSMQRVLDLYSGSDPIKSGLVHRAKLPVTVRVCS